MTAATVSISESNTFSQTITASITNSNMGSTDAVNLDAVVYPCPTTGYSYEKWQRINVSNMGTSSAIRNLRVYDSGALGTGATHKTNARTSSYGGAQTYDTTNGPQNTDRSATYGYTQTMPTSIPGTTKAQAIEKICKYTKAIFYVKWRNDVTGYVGTYLPCAYLIKQTEIDSVTTGLDLPAEATLSYNGGIDASDLGRYLKGEITADFKGEDQYNFVTVRCQDLYGNWLTSTNVVNNTYASDVYDPVINPTGTAIKRSYYEENSDINNQSDLDARAVDIYAYYHCQIQTWKATFFKRSDLELLQKAYIWGFGSVVIPDGTYRIIDIQYDYADGGAKNEVTVTFIPDTQFVTYLNLRRVYYNSIYEIQNVVNDIIGTQPASLFGTITQTTATGAVTFSVQQDNAIVNYYQGYDPTKALAAGTRVLAVPDAKGKYICAKLG